MGLSAPLVGRVSELAWLRHAAARSKAGQPRAVLVHGEPGVGKTRVVTEFADELGREGFRVLWGRCVRFAAEASSYLPIAQALGSRLEVTDAASAGGSVLHRVGAAVGEMMATGPVVLVLDDVQWADVSSLDVLTYLVAGFADGQPLLVLGTYRDTELGVGHPLHGWLADMRRMPGVNLLPLGRFDRHDTGLLVHALLGADHRASLVEQAFLRSDGNAYLVELLVQNLEPVAEQLPAELPRDLRQALLAAWHRLSSPARELMQVLAVGGRPVDVSVLAHVAAAVSAARGTSVAAGVAETIDAGLAVLGDDGSVWFQHPLVAEVLVSTVLPPEAARVHAAYVTVWLAAESAPERLRAAHLALHYEASADVSAALVWSLRAAVEAARVRGFGEESHHLSAACRLWPLADARRRREAGPYVDLLLRATRAAHRAGDVDTALSLGERAYELTKENGDPLVCCRVLIELNILRQLHGRRPSLATLREAVELSSGFPRSPEHVRALATVASYEQRLGMPEAAEHAAEALDAARACGSDEALAHALIGAADAGCGQAEALAFAAEAMELSRRVGDGLFISSSAIAWANCLLTCGRGPEAGPFLLDVYQELVRAGAPHEAGKMAVEASMHLLVFGDWSRCRDLLREAMSIRMATFFARNARLVAATLAVRCGDLSAARLHLHRAMELAEAGAGGLDDWYISAAADVLVARGKYLDALALITREIQAVVRYDPAFADELMATAAAAMASLAEREPEQRRQAISRLDELEAIRAAVKPAMSVGLVPGDPVPAAFGALYTAHRSRLAAERDAGIRAWEQAVSACHAAALPWEAARAQYHLAATLLAQRTNRSLASSALLDAHHVAVDLGDEPLRADLEALALQAHVSLTDQRTRGGSSIGRHVLDRLTAREREVLEHVVAGRTYVEIARSLFISEKTVSVHVSNLLRKTGTTNRIQLAALAGRLTGEPSRNVTPPPPEPRFQGRPHDHGPSMGWVPAAP